MWHSHVACVLSPSSGDLMGRIIDIKGQRFGRLTAVQMLGLDQHHKTRWLCRCDCGGETITTITTLRRGSSQSCGCFQRERAGDANRTHGASRLEIEYRTWSSMIRRCHNPNTKDFKNYGGRGIKVCPEWRASYPAFLTHVGRRPSPGHSIDRINNDGDYCPGNVRWVTRAEQMRNKRPSIPTWTDERRKQHGERTRARHARSRAMRSLTFLG